MFLIWKRKTETGQSKTRKKFSPTSILTFGETNQDGAEELKTVKIKFNEAVEKVLSGEITHAPSGVLILKAAKSERVKK